METILPESWCLYFENPKNKAEESTWLEDVKKVSIIRTVEEFWGTLDNIVPIFKIPVSNSYFFFKDGVRPEWESPENKNGGKWLLQLSAHLSLSDIRACWEKILMAMVGDQFADHNVICGAVYSIKQKQVKLSVWTRNDTSSIGTDLARLCNLKTQPTYKSHH